MKKTTTSGVVLRTRYVRCKPEPRWAIGRGIWYPGTHDVKTGVTPTFRWRPKVNTICEPLLGASQFAFKGGERKIIGVRFPEMKRRLALYHEGLELVWTFGLVSDLLLLAMYRRQVTEKGDMPLDDLFVLLAGRLKLSKDNWAQIARRMPDESWIKGECELRALLSSSELEKIAAE